MSVTVNDAATEIASGTALLPPDLAGLFPYRSRWLAVPGGRYHYVDEGPREAAPLLCVHGNPTWAFYWRGLVQAFRGDARVVVPDHIGCGGSDKPERFAYTLHEHALNLERLVLALDLRDITLVVHDWGGAIGMGLAARHPDRIARLVITNTAAFADPRVPLRIRACRAPGLGALLVRGLDAFAGLAPRMAVERRLEPDVARAMRFPYRGFGSGGWARRVAIHGFVRDIPTSAAHPTAATLAAIEAALPAFAGLPACIVWGERDWCFTPRFRERWQHFLPRAEVHALPDAGHWVMEDAPDEVVRILHGFLERHPIAGRSAR